MEPIDQLHRAITLFSRISRVRADLYPGLGFVQYSMVAYVDTVDCAHAADLAEEFGLDRSTVSRQLAELEGDGLMVRGPDPNHPRKQKLELTLAGHKALALARSAQRSRIKGRLSDWPEQDVADFARLFDRFVNGFS